MATDLLECLVAALLAEFLLELDLHDGQESAVQEQFRVVHKDRIGAKSEFLEVGEAPVPSSVLFVSVHVAFHRCGSAFDELVYVEFLTLGEKILPFLVEELEESIDNDRVELAAGKFPQFGGHPVER